jgi:4,5-DOPA dioxygenase extradiol
MRQPTLFLAHGSPMNAIADNAYTQAMNKLGASLAPRAVLLVSAHWQSRKTLAHAGAMPRTIHDFSGFPPELSAIQYPAPGAPELAKRLVERELADACEVDEAWGFDHGAWSVLRHVFPKADVPVLMLSLSRRMRPLEHAALAKRLSPLRDDGVLIIGSGNVVHNLGELDWDGNWTSTPGWVTDVDAYVAAAAERHDLPALCNVRDATGASGPKAIPTWEHYLPLLYAAGAATLADVVTYPYVGIDMGSLSMRSIRFG